MNLYKQDIQSQFDYLLDLENPESDALLTKLFERVAGYTKVVLELGCSNGAFLVERAKENPGVFFLGLECRYKLATKGAVKARTHKLDNVFFLRGYSEKIHMKIPQEFLDEIWLFFPDPWPKPKQQKNRVFSEKQLLHWSSLLKSSGKIYFKTDHPGYFQWALALLGLDHEIQLNLNKVSLNSVVSKTLKQTILRTSANKEVPSVSQAVLSAYKVINFTSDYHSQEKALKDLHLFGQSLTLFERLFLKEQLPVYFLALESKSSSAHFN